MRSVKPRLPTAHVEYECHVGLRSIREFLAKWYDRLDRFIRGSKSGKTAPNNRSRGEPLHAARRRIALPDPSDGEFRVRDANKPDITPFLLQGAADKIRSILLALERDHDIDIQRVEVDCKNLAKFTTTIHCRQ